MGDILGHVIPPKEKKKEAKRKYVAFTSGSEDSEWAYVERFFGRPVETHELKAFVLALGVKVNVSLT